MANHQGSAITGRNKTPCTLHQGDQGLAAADGMVQKIRFPRRDLERRDGPPEQPVPTAEVELRQIAIDPVHEAEGPQPAPHCQAAFERRSPDHARQTLTPSMGADAVRQAFGAAPIDRQIGAPDATTLGTDGSRVAPDHDDTHSQRAASAR